MQSEGTRCTDIDALRTGFRELKCCHVKPGFGTAIFLEFGAPRIEISKRGTRSVRGDISIAVYATDWILNHPIVQNINAENFKQPEMIGALKSILLGMPLPTVERLNAAIMLVFDNGRFSLEINQSVYDDKAKELVHIFLPDGRVIAHTFECKEFYV